MMSHRWYEGKALMTGVASHRHEISGTTGEEIERRVSNHCPDVVAILVREKSRTKARHGSTQRTRHKEVGP